MHKHLLPALTIFCALMVTPLSLGEENKPLHVVAFGDSITGNRPGEAYLQHYMKWTDLLGLMIEARQGMGSAVVYNAGYAGDATARRGDRPGAVNRIEEDILARSPDIAIILIGGNDAGGRVKKDETRENLQQIFSQSSEAGIRVLALQYAVLYDPENPGNAWKHLVDNNDLIAEVAADLEIPTLALQPYFDAAAKASGSHRSLLNDNDRVHLQPGGEIVVARAVFAKLLELGWIE